ncbi:MAG: hypothetical protein FJY56_05665 [Betaproteobacteria bacterium]|nr:hypothetical protein [Betaproteobacteria bacterium]
MAGATQTGKRKSSAARAIKSQRDYDAVLGVTQRLLAMPNRDTAAERRLKALLEKMDRYEETHEDADNDDADTMAYGGAYRRWSDDAAEH